MLSGVSAWHNTTCDQMRLRQPVNFYIAEHAQSPLPVKQGDELWIEVTVPPKGPPRPIQLALKQPGAWKSAGVSVSREQSTEISHGRMGLAAESVLNCEL